ncbi:hypothetical protein SORBI_3001G140101 [Sorghum bicolor]|uniref:Uncharacterized protein n=1 Tax=Sorghum bicolor TaxID=4558 RepID=A0A1Z5S5K5_SORBI|nr:hypothetical protein SORBI_3001G140101 [Sorghum bicolor]
MASGERVQLRRTSYHDPKTTSFFPTLKLSFLGASIQESTWFPLEETRRLPRERERKRRCRRRPSQHRRRRPSSLRGRRRASRGRRSAGPPGSARAPTRRAGRTPPMSACRRCRTSPGSTWWRICWDLPLSLGSAPEIKYV